MTDARPFRPTAPSDWDRAVADRAHIETILRDTLRAEGVDAAVIPSEDGIYPPWVRVQAWMGKDTGRKQTYRSLVDFVIDAKPYHRKIVVRTMKLANGPKKIELAERPNLSDADVAAWARHALGRAPRPSSYRPWQEALLGFAARFHLAHPAHINELAKDFRPQWFTAEGVMLLLAIFCGSLAFSSMNTYESAGGGLVIAVLAAVFLALFFIIPRFRVVAVDAPAQPSATAPRRLVEVDEWHAVATGLAEHADNFAKHVGLAIERAAQGSDVGMAYAVETVHHVTPNGYEARPRYVLKRGHAEVHLDINDVGDDLFVGWNANLNWLQWGETQPVSKRKAGLIVTHHVALAPGFYTPTQLDLIDLACLTELVHRCVKKELEGLLKAAAIDQQIDFEITRGDRARALDRKRHGTSAEERGEGRWGDIMKSYARWSSGAATQSMRSAASTPLRPVSGNAGFPAALTVVAVWAAGRLALWLLATGLGTLTELGQTVYSTLGSFVTILALAVGAWRFAKLPLRHCVAICVGSVVLLTGLTAEWASLYFWALRDYDFEPSFRFILLPLVYSATFALSLFLPLMVALPTYRRMFRVVVFFGLVIAIVPLTAYVGSSLYLDRESFEAIFMARTALVLGLLGYWLPRR